MVAGAIAAATALLVYSGWLAMSLRRVINQPPQVVLQNPEPVLSEPKAQTPPTAPPPAAQPETPVSLKIASNFYNRGDYENAMISYQRLLENLVTLDKEDRMADFLWLRLALCHMKKGDFERCDELLKSVTQSRSAMIGILANYCLSRLEMQKRQYLAARMRAYQVIALIDAVDPEAKWSRNLRRNCFYLVAEALSKQALSFSDADSNANKDLPSQLWSYREADPESLFSDDEKELRTCLSKGAQVLDKGLLGPKIAEAADADGIRRWSVIAKGASIDELLGRFSANTGHDINWAMDFNKIDMHNRPVNLYLPLATESQIISVAAGCAGLLAFSNEKNVITVYNPAEYAYVSEQVTRLGTEAIECWQKFILSFFDDPSLANVHFVLGLLRAQQGSVGEAIAEYKMVANRFSKSALAPEALFYSAHLKIGLHDHSGAYEDLRGLVELYPESGKANQAYLLLAETAVKQGKDTEAVKIYSRLFHLNLSAQSQSVTAMALGKLFYKMGDLTAAEKWLTRYMELAADEKGVEYYQACVLLGKARMEMGNSQLACQTMINSLSGQLPQEEYIQAVTLLIEGYLKQGALIQAMSILHETSLRQFSQENSVQLLVLKSRVFRGMGLADKAVTLLADKEAYLLDDQLKAQIGYELGECYCEQGELQLAYKSLSKTLEWAGSGPLAHNTLLKLAQICLTLELDDQAQSACSRLLGMQPSGPIRQKTLEFLAAVYNKQKIMTVRHWR
jgi:TolA-binding protein